MSVENTALVLECFECLDLWPPESDERWRAYLDADGELVLYCPECAQYEVGV